MAKGFGIVALMLALVAIVIPLGFSLLVTYFAMVLAIIAALGGDRVFSSASAIIGAINTFLLSPLALTAILNEPSVKIVTILLLVAPFVAMIFSVGKVGSIRRIRS